MELEASMAQQNSLQGLMDGPAPVVLVLDDNDDLREMVVFSIEAHGFRTASATNGAEALTYLSRGLRPALIILDLMMPVMDGWEVLHWLKDQRELSAIPVVIVSAGSDRPASAEYFVKKPFDFDILIDIVR